MPFRSTILLQSALSGAVIGLIAGAVMFAGALAIWMILPESAARTLARGRVAGMVICFVVLPLAGAAVGWLEGRLKL